MILFIYRVRPYACVCQTGSVNTEYLSKDFKKRLSLYTKVLFITIIPLVNVHVTLIYFVSHFHNVPLHTAAKKMTIMGASPSAFLSGVMSNITENGIPDTQNRHTTFTWTKCTQIQDEKVQDKSCRKGQLIFQLVSWNEILCNAVARFFTRCQPC